MLQDVVARNAAAVAFRSIAGRERFLPRMAKREQSGVVKKHPFQGRTAPRQLSERQLASDASCAVTCWRAMPFP